MNSTQVVKQTWYKNLLIIYSVVMTIILVSGFIGNFLNLFIFYRYKAIRSFTRVLLIQITVYDILGLAFSGLQIEHFVLNGAKDYRLDNRLACIIQSFTGHVFVYGSMHTVCTVAIDRYLLVRYPTSLMIRSLSRKHGLIVCICNLVVNMIINIPYLEVANINEFICTSPLIQEVWYKMINSLFYAAIPAVGALIPSTLMIYELKKHNRHFLINNNKQNSLNSHIWAIKMVIVTSVYMSITFSGINLASILSSMGIFGNYHFLFPTVGIGFWILLHSNCSIKFYLYNLSTSQFRRNLFKLICNVKSVNDIAASQSVSMKNEINY